MKRPLFTKRLYQYSPVLLLCSTTTISSRQRLLFANSFLFHLPSRTRIESQRFFSVDTTNPSERDLQNRWEQMYSQENPSSSRLQQPRQQQQSPVRVVTFDLDNTLWNTSATIQAANEALAEHMQNQHQSTTTTRVETVMGTLFKANPQQYCPLWKDPTLEANKKNITVQPQQKHPPSPVLLTQLRKDAIRTLLGGKDSLNDGETLTRHVEEAFQVWIDARHTAVPHHLATDVVPSLQRLRRELQDDDVLIGAITDGNSNPQAISILQDLFDFCVQAEQVGVCKPDRRVFEHAIAQHVDNTDAAGPWWVHIGDDFIKDIVAAKAMGMRTIWAREWILDKLPPPPKNDEHNNNQRSTDDDDDDITTTLRPGSTRIMAIGADDYLAHSMETEFADATVDTFVEITDVVLQWHEEWRQQQSIAVRAVSRDDSQYNATETTVADTAVAASHKFCMDCGEKLPHKLDFVLRVDKKREL